MRGARDLLLRPTMVSLFWWPVVIVGWAVIVEAALTGLVPDVVVIGAPLAMMALLVVGGELRPVITPWSGAIPVPFSAAFVFAALYLWGLSIAVLLMALGVLISEIAEGKPAWKLLFNVAQYSLSVAAAWLVMFALGATHSPADPAPALTGLDLPWLVATWVVYHLVNLALVAGMAPANGQTWVESFTEDFWFYTWSTMAVLALSPLVAIVASAGPWSWLLLPLLVLPLITVYATARLSRARDHDSLHDPLTDLPNRALLSRRTAEAVVQSGVDGAGLALCLLDLDRFKEVNDTLGHATGDLLLREIAHRLADAVRPSDTVARLGGDEFAVLLPGAGRAGDAIDVAQRVQAILAAPIVLQGVPVDVSVSVGVALLPPNTKPAAPDGVFETLLRHADVAMYLAKDDRRGLAVYDQASDHHSPDRLAAMSDLRAAISNGEVGLHYQPQVSLADGRIVGLEALARWTHPSRGLIPPDEFIPLAERTGVIHDLTAVVLDQAMAQAAEWRAAGIDLPVSVNVSMRDLQDIDVVTLVTDTLNRHRLPADYLHLEVTESVLVKDAARVTTVVRQLRDAGVQCALDDFGTGFSTLVLLQQIPVTEVKIDRSFVTPLDRDGEDGLVSAVVGLAHGLGLRVVAEGVESDRTQALLRDLGCDVAQGYGISRPMPPAVATSWLADRMSRAVDTAMDEAPHNG